MTLPWQQLRQAALVGLALWVWPALAQPEAGTAPALRGAMHMSRLAEPWIQQGDDEPERLLAALGALAKLERPPAGLSRSMWLRSLWRTQALIAARSGRVKAMQVALERLRQLDPQRQDPLLRADQALVLAQYEDLQGQTAEAEHDATAAQVDYEQACQAPSSAPACDLRAWWRSLRILTQQASEQGQHVQARQLAQKSLELARRAADTTMEVRSLLALADAHRALREDAAQRQQLQAAAKLAAQAESIPIWVYVNLAQVEHGVGSLAPAALLQRLEKALALAQLLGSARLEAQVQLWLSRCWMVQGQPDKAAKAAEQALRVARRHGDLRLQARLLHVAGLAYLQLGQPKHGQANLETALGLWQQMGARAAQAQALREHSQALSQLGDAAGALKLYHQERRLLDEIEQGNRQALVSQLRQRFAVEAQRNELARLRNERELSQRQLDNQRLVVTLAVLTLSVLAAAGALVLLLGLRLRDANRRLRLSEASLRVQSERDALTGLANRRYFYESLQAEGLLHHFKGAVLLLDIDHFKRINDVCGHAAGDVVLAEVAKRIAATVRGGDLACRWGGEEFLVFTQHLHGDGLDALAQRLLHAIGDRSVRLPNGQALEVRVCVGYASFPLPEQFLPVSWERALKLVDMVLYTAKATGRDRALGLHALNANLQASDLDAIEHEFDLRRLRYQAELRSWPRQAAQLSPLPPESCLES
jgi:diguanylate cyclase (GGDEF)-like protein